MSVIGIVGLIGSGKNTVGNILVDRHDFIRVSFADSLKDAVAAIFGWDRGLLQGETEESRKWREQPDPYWSRVLGHQVTPRWILQHIGTDVMRNHFHTDIWVHSLMKRIDDPTKNYVVSDVRFRNEIGVIMDGGGAIVEVQRQPLPEWYGAKFSDYDSLACHMEIYHPRIHQSEWDWFLADRSAVIQNDGSLEDLAEKVSAIIAV